MSRRRCIERFRPPLAGNIGPPPPPSFVTPSVYPSPSLFAAIHLSPVHGLAHHTGFNSDIRERRQFAVDPDERRALR